MMKDELTGEEKEHFIYAGKFMIYMQAMRFLTDHLNNDIYYGAKYEGQNFVTCRQPNHFTAAVNRERSNPCEVELKVKVDNTQLVPRLHGYPITINLD